MKPHIRLRVKGDTHLPKLPHWYDLKQNPSLGISAIHQDVDDLFSKYQIPIWATQEYKPSGQRWNQAEVESGLNRVYRLVLQRDSKIPDSLIKEISLLPQVEEVQIGAVGQAPLPSMRAAQMSVDSSRTDLQSRQAIYLPEAHEWTKGLPSITVAVLDTGVNTNHPEYVENLLPGYDFVDILDGAKKFVGDYLGVDDDPDDEVGHGTHVAGIIAAHGKEMPIGVVPNCKILPVRVLGAMKRGNKRFGAGLVDNINDGIKWAIDHGADVINMSLGIQHTGGGLPHKEVVDYAQKKNVTIVAASGNDGQEERYYPGSLPHVIAVGAVDEVGEIAHFSTYGNHVDLVAPGTNIYSTYVDNGYSFSTGTSHASPFVAGAVAMLKSYALEKRQVQLSDPQIKHILKHTADKVDRRFKHRKAGFGKLNLIDALRLLDHKLGEHKLSDKLSA